jgi:CheY-like chemotaxis protein
MAENRDGMGGLVLLAEDEEPVRRFTAALLAELGFTVAPATDGAEALEVFRSRRGELALILLDLTMPGMSGEDVLAALEREGAGVPVILCSGYDARELRARFAGRAVGGFLQKPYRLEELRTVVAAAVGRTGG